MKSLHFPTLFLPLLAIVFASPSPVQIRDGGHGHDDDNPTPTRLFTVAAFQSPNPVGSGVSGLTMQASGGLFWVNPDTALAKPSTGCGDKKGKNCPPGNETVLFVDKFGQAWLDSTNPQQIYLNTATGSLSYLTSTTNPQNTFAPGAILTNFRHLGQGTSVTSTIPGTPPQFVNPGPGTFHWQGSDNPTWFLCPRPGPGYQVLKDVGGNENWGACLSGIALVALDYAGAEPAAGVYL